MICSKLIPLLEELTRDGLQSGIFDLIDQSKTIRDWLSYNFNEWTKIRNKKKIVEKDVLLVSELFKVEKILQQEILYNFICGNTGRSLSYRKLQKVFELVYKKNEYWELHISGEWKICRSRKEIRLSNRLKT